MTTKKRTRAARKVRRLVRHDAEFLADQIDAVATLMWAMAERMEYYAGFSGELNKHAREMAGASTIARGWAKAIRGHNAPALPPQRSGGRQHALVVPDLEQPDGPKKHEISR